MAKKPRTKLPVPYAPKLAIAPTPQIYHIPSATEAEMALNLQAIDDCPRLKLIDNLAQNLPAKPLQTPTIPLAKTVERSPMLLRLATFAVGILIYAAAVANNVYSCWLLTGAAFWTTV